MPTGADAEFPAALRERIMHARELLAREEADAVNDVGVSATPSLLGCLLGVAGEHGIEVAVSPRDPGAREAR